MKPLIVRLVHARRYFEISGNKGPVYNFISSLLHGDPVPSNKIREDQYQPLSESEKAEAVQDLQGLSLVDNYQQMLQRLDEPNLLSDYKRSHSNYEKMAIARALLDRFIRRLGKPVDYALNSLFHIEQESLFNCKFFAEDYIPSYLVSFVDAKLKQLFPTLN